MDTSSVSEQERQSAEAVSRSESAMFPFDKPESEDVWSSVVFELPATTSSSASAGPLMALEEGLEGLLSLSPGAGFSFVVLKQMYAHCPMWNCAHSQPQHLGR